MEKNLLKEEIYRIHEMMGINSKPILTEGIEDDILKLVTRNADQAASGVLSSAQKVAKLRSFGGFSNLPDNEVLKLIDDYTRASNKTKAIGDIIGAMDGSIIRSIASDIYVNSLDAQKIVGDLLDDYADMWSKGNFATLDDAKAAFEKQLRAGLGDPPAGFSRIYDQIIEVRKAGLETRLDDVVKGNSGSSTVDDVTSTETKYYTDADYNLDKIKAELKKAYNEAYSQGKIPKSADGTPMPQDLGDEFFDFYAKEITNATTPEKFALIRKELITTFGSDPKTLADKLRSFTKSMGYGPGIAKLMFEMLTVPFSVAFKLWKQHKGAIIGLTLAATVGTMGWNFYQNWKAGGKSGFGINEGETLYCWQNNVLTFNDLDLDIQKKLVDATGVGCEEFDSGDNTKIPKMVTEKESENTGKIFYVVEYMDGHKQEFDENFASSNSGGTTPTPNPNTGNTYSNDPAGYKKYAEDKGGTYGTTGNYVMQDNVPFYKDSYGEWQAGSYNGTTFVTN
jgi:hypothetical protein